MKFLSFEILYIFFNFQILKLLNFNFLLENFYPLPMVYRPPLPIEYRPPYPCYIDRPTYGILTPPTHGISTPLLMVF